LRDPLSAYLDDHYGGDARRHADDGGYGGRQPLGYAIVGGLALSQILTLYTTPVIYIYFDRLQNWLSQRRRIEVPAAQLAPAPAE